MVARELIFKNGFDFLVENLTIAGDKMLMGVVKSSTPYQKILTAHPVPLMNMDINNLESLVMIAMSFGAEGAVVKDTNYDKPQFKDYLKEAYGDYYSLVFGNF